jgi:carbonic anhydrase
VAPELVFDEGPGDLFVIRIAGNFVNEDGLASLEFGSAVLGSQLIMVLGHSECGAIKATIDVVENGTELPGHLPALATALRPGVEKAIAEKPANLLEAATAENVRFNVASLKAATPIIADLVASGKLEIVGGVYDIATGKVTMV